jgi:hypothetical protein
MLDLCLSTSAQTVALAPAKVAPSPQRLRGRLGADDVTTGRGRGSEGFGPLEAMPPHQRVTDLLSAHRPPQPRPDATLGQMLPAGAWSRSIGTSGFEVVASLGRRRTSTVNEGTARLNVVLDTADRTADSSRRSRPCEAKRNKHPQPSRSGPNGQPPESSHLGDLPPQRVAIVG